MIGYWFYKFDVEDRDIGTVEYTAFKDQSEIKYPVATLCFTAPFSRRKVVETDPNLNITNYSNYIEGESFEEKFHKIDYGNITLDLNDYFNYSYVKLRNGTELRGGYEINGIGTFSHKVNFNGISEWGYFCKCFELSWNTTNEGSIKMIHLVYNRQALLQDRMTSESWFDLYVHYPGQFLLAPNDPETIYISSDNQSPATYIDDVEILKSRNTQKRKCTTYDEKVSFDAMVKDKHIIEEQCILPYFSPYQNLPKCDTKEKIRKSSFKYPIVRTRYYPISCQRLSKISLSAQNYDNDNDDLSEGEWGFHITYPQYFRTVTLTKEVDIHSLIGNVGGYVGLFLGNFYPQQEKTYIFNILKRIYNINRIDYNFMRSF